MKIRMNELRKTIRKVIQEESNRLLTENRSYAQKIAELIATNDLGNIRSALELAEQVDLIYPRDTNEPYPGEFSVIVSEELWTQFRYPNRRNPDDIKPSRRRTKLGKASMANFHARAYMDGQTIPGHTLMTIDAAYQIEEPTFKVAADGKTTQRRPLDYELKDDETSFDFDPSKR
jgi:hypothetical protein